MTVRASPGKIRAKIKLNDDVSKTEEARQSEDERRNIAILSVGPENPRAGDTKTVIMWMEAQTSMGPARLGLTTSTIKTLAEDWPKFLKANPVV